MRRTRKALRSIALAALILAALGMRIPLPGDSARRILVVDCSLSTRITPEAARRLARPGGELVVFGRNAAAARATPIEIDRDATKIGPALAVLDGLIDDPDGTEVVLVTDGRLDPAATADGIASLVARRAKVMIVRAGRPVRDAAVDTLEAPASTAPGQPIVIRAIVRSTLRGPARLELRRDGELIATVDRTLSPGLRVFSFRDAPTGGLVEYEARLRPLAGDAVPENNVARAATRTLDGRRLGVIGDTPGTPVRALGDGATTIVPLPPHTDNLAGLDGIVVLDTPAHRLAGRGAAIASFVRAGGGLVAAGAAHAFGPGGYAGSPLEGVLPLWASPRDEGEEMTVVFVIDTSGSMAGEAGDGMMKIDHAERALAAAMPILGAEAETALIAFDRGARVLLSPGMHSIDRMRGRLAERPPSGGTDIHPALEAARRLLAGRDGTRHAILISDGKSVEGDTNALCGALRANGITVSTIATGGARDDELLRQVARLCNGRYYEADDVSGLEGLLGQEAAAVGEGLLVRGPVALARGDAAQILPDGPLPSPAVLARTAPKETAAVEATAPTEGLPAVAAWTVEMGRAVAIAFSPPADGRLLKSAVEWAVRPRAGAEVTARLDDGEIAVEMVTATTPPADALARGTIARGEGAAPISMRRSGPRRFEGRTPVLGEGLHLIACRLSTGEAGRAFADVSCPPELRAVGPDEAALARLAKVAGGTVYADASALPPVGRRTGTSWPLPAVAAILVLVDMALERIRTG